MALFGLKSWEIARGRILAPVMRTRFDDRAMQLKDLLAAARLDAAKLLPLAVVYTRIGIHEAALALAVFARFAERQAHRLADLVSYKHHYEKRETQSEFLKKVSEGKNSNGLDTTE